jgi:hypothetical protein
MGRRFEAAARGEERSASVTALGLTAAPANLPAPAMDRDRGEREQVRSTTKKYAELLGTG